MISMGEHRHSGGGVADQEFFLSIIGYVSDGL